MFDFTMTMAMLGGSGAAGGGGMMSAMMPMLIIMAIFYFMLIRPRPRKEKERRSMIDALESGTRVMFSGGIIGTVTNVKEHTFVVKIADNVKVEIARGAVSRILEKGEKPEDVDA